MNSSMEASTLSVGAIGVAALVVPYLVATARQRVAGDSVKVSAYGPHLMLLCIVRFIPLLKAGSPAPVASWVAFGQVVALWAGAVVIGEWMRSRRRRIRARDV
jgi:hypothetical protein